MTNHAETKYESIDDECSKTDWHYIPDKFRTSFVSPNEQYKEYVGSPFIVLGRDEEASRDLDEFEYLYKIRFEDGTEITAWGEEVCVADPDPAPIPAGEIVGESPDGRPVLKLETGGVQVQPHDDNYWITIDTLEQTTDAYQHPEKYPNPRIVPMPSFATRVLTARSN